MYFAHPYKAFFIFLICLQVFSADLPSSIEMQRIFEELGNITQMPPKKTAPLEQMTRQEFHHYLQDRLKKSAKPAEIKEDELTMKWLGLVPEDFNLQQSTVDLLTEQAAAFYDYRKKKLVMVENPLGEYSPSLLAHELAHALADQYFRIGRYMDEGAKTDDSVLARQAVIEGQASWLMNEWELRRNQRESLLKNDDPLPKWSSFQASSYSSFPVLQKAPLYLQVSLLFPYWEGGRFQQAVIAKKGISAFREVFLNPPSTTQQILHPELYLSNQGADTPDLPKVKFKGWKPMTRGTLGELDHLVIFKMQDHPEAEELASTWRGAAYEVRRSKSTCCILLYTSRWKDEESAERALNAWRKHSLKKSPRGSLQIRREGRDIIAIEGAPE